MRSLPAALTAALALAGCSGTVDADNPITPEGRTFVSISVDGEQIPGGGPLTVNFDENRISTFAGCNHGSGTADLSGGRVVTQLASTMMACPPPLGDADAWVSKFFQASPSWSLTGDTLTLKTTTATVTMKDKKVVDPDRPLTGTVWLVQSLVSPQAISTSIALERARPTLTINADGAVTGWTGCNHVTGHADLANAPGDIAFGPLTGQGNPCPAEVGEIQQAVLNVLGGHVRSSINADELRLTRDDGYGLILRSQG
ncbi:META domain-containing protein [Mycobacterium sp. 155]|uniref:META domain-containing protein n=1 Tax=Mycobacterium sp. 155 TaxID=1157943 RepID=UPI000477C7C2|nr:META domain-containing protein [Mycobacterium sp. 155]